MVWSPHLLQAAGPFLHCIKDPTRGGVATSLNEIAISSEVSIALDEKAIPVRAGVRGACEILGLDPLTIANEGKLLAIVAPEGADAALAALRAHPLGQAKPRSSARFVPSRLRWSFCAPISAARACLDMLVGDPLPRIC